MKSTGMIPKKYTMMKYALVLIAFFIACLSLHAQESITIKGSVIDLRTSAPVADANISIKGVDEVNTESSENGEFQIEVPSLYSVLVITMPGYQVAEFPLWGNENVVIELLSDNLGLDNPYVKLPYSMDKTSNLNGAFSVIAESYDKTIRYKDIYQMLEGAVPGLEVNAYSGVPGEGSQFNMRGVKSLYSNNMPLVVVDGVPVVNQVFDKSVAEGNLYNFIADVNVKDIESISVLRDAAAAGIYGSRASNGVISITTKQGTNGKSFLDVSVQQGLSLRYKEIPVLDGAEYLSYFSDKLYREGIDQSTINEQFSFLNNTNMNTVDYRMHSNNTNWQKEVTRNSLSQDYYMNLRGGDAKSKYSLHIGYKDVDGVVRGVFNNQFTTRFNLDFRISEKLTAGMRMGFARTTKNLMDQGYSERTNPLYLGMVKPPIFSIYQKSSQGLDGPFLSQPGYDLLSNPMAVVDGVKNEVTNTWILGSVYAQYEFSKAVKTKIVMSIDRKGLEEDRFTPSNGIVPLNNDSRFDRTSEEQLITDRIMRVEHTLSYEKMFNQENRIFAFAGYNLEVSEYNSSYGYSIHSTSDDFQGLGDGLKLDMSGINELYRNASVFANVDYTFKEKFFVKGGIRFDGSSRFGDQADGAKIASVPFAILPYAGITWKLKAEPLFNSISSLDDLKLRLSWGMTANQNIPVNARYSLYGSQYYQDRPGFAPVSIGNPAVKWEETNNANLGLDLSLWKKALGVNLDLYSNKTTDILLPQYIDGSNGANYFWNNGGEINNRGIELGLSTFGHRNEWTWRLQLNIAKNVNEIKLLPNSFPIYEGENGFVSTAKAGSEFGLIYGYENLGVFSTQSQVNGLLNENGEMYHAGDFRFADKNSDAIITEKDLVVIGNPNPDFFGGIKAGVSYKNISLNASFTYSYGNEILNVLRMKLETGSGYENQSVSVLKRWMKEGDVTSIPNTRLGDPANNQKPSSYYIEDGSYLKMKSLSLCYDIDKRIGFIRNAQIYLTGYNLFTITNYLGLDPEVSLNRTVFSRGYDFGVNPTPKMFMLGVKLSL